MSDFVEGGFQRSEINRINHCYPLIRQVLFTRNRDDRCNINIVTHSDSQRFLNYEVMSQVFKICTVIRKNS